MPGTIAITFFTEVADLIRAGSRWGGGSRGANPPFTFQTILQCIDDVSCFC